MMRVRLTQGARPEVDRGGYVKPKVAAAEKTACSSPPKNPTPTPPYKGGGSGSVGRDQKDGVEEITERALALSPSDRKALLAQLALAGQRSDAADLRDSEMWSLAVYTALGEALRGGGGASAGPALIKRLLGAPAAFAPVAEFMESSKLGKMKVTERQSVYHLLAGLVVDKAKYIAGQGKAPMSAKLCASVAVNIDAIFDQSFPGYLASGLAPLVAKQLVRDRA